VSAIANNIHMKRKTMNRKLMTLMAFCAFGVTTTAVPAYSGSLETFRVTVPFAFMAGAVNMPAGDYTVLEAESHVVMLRGSRRSAMLLATAGDEGDSYKTALTFRHTDRGYFLQTVCSGGAPANLFRVVTETEK
jgi:hypothetical protein